jgi:hypothetical protein
VMEDDTGGHVMHIYIYTHPFCLPKNCFLYNITGRDLCIVCVNIWLHAYLASLQSALTAEAD